MMFLFQNSMLARLKIAFVQLSVDGEGHGGGIVSEGFTISGEWGMGVCGEIHDENGE